jgi:ATP-dependent Clp protease adaptor protein ClpS
MTAPRPSAALRTPRPPRAAPRPAGQPPAAPVTETEPETTTQLGFPWCVIVWDDPVNLMSYVVYVFQKLFGFSLQKATKHMLEVHEQGKSLVATADRERAEFYVTRLHAYGLQATLERSGGE